MRGAPRPYALSTVLLTGTDPAAGQRSASVAEADDDHPQPPAPPVVPRWSGQEDSVMTDRDSNAPAPKLPEPEPTRSQKAPKPPKPRKVERRRKGRKG